MSGLNALQLRAYIVRPALRALSMWSRAAEELVMGTAAQESRLEYIHQLGGGPALGLFQMEPATHDDIWTNYLDYRPQLAGLVRSLVARPVADTMVHDARYAAAMCRLHYRRVPAPLPDPEDIHAMAAYWDTHYNRNPTKGHPWEFVENFRLVQ